MYNNFNNNATSSFGSSLQSSQGSQASQGYQSNNSQNQGYQRQYQPVGNVQSFYSQPTSSNYVLGNNQSYNQSYNQNSNQGSSQGYSQRYNQDNNQSYNQAGMASTDSFHMANYRGNQTGHDAYLRSDSSTSSQYQPSSFQSAYSTYNGANNQYTSNQNQPFSYTAMHQQPSITSQYGGSSQMSQQPSSQAYTSPNAYHTANYRGNQPGHDSYLRSESSSSSMQSSQPSYASQQQQGMQQFGYQQQGQQGTYQQSYQPYNQAFSSTGLGQQYGNNYSN
ncbi:hypothetical protein [Paenibacillus aceris]|uniref:Spore coat protein n=1 Tax=Paenibacillus aceris TaxID=869555 RepID=A0ABS4HRN4_9BACL|nr:hypothetical protein [Paenibacillus aceris]MBP1961277.1 hypothetical protein [Paenibacillus aceris]NHW37935.1 hypothetical protein [Paenibacillus aceris]